jgi:hypothetical protein
MLEQTEKVDSLFPEGVMRMTDVAAAIREVTQPLKLSGAMTSVVAKITTGTLEAGDMDLDALLAESLEQASTAATAKVARARLKTEKHKLTPLEIEELEQEIERHELVQNWEVVGAAVAFTRTLCKCGKQHTAFETLLERQQHRREPGTQRWHRVKEIAQFAPRSVIFHEVEVPLCADCAFEQGWDLRDGEVKAYERY